MDIGQVVTFYSYKGGVGRTMALANVAVLLSQWGYKVLIVDWDLEAPGLEFYFRDYIDPKIVSQKEGIIDLISQKSYEQSQSHNQIRWQDVIASISLKNSEFPLNLITAGKRNEDYFKKVRSLDLQDFYARKEGGVFFESLRDEWKHEYDYVLIDSRTGITDIGGVCTIQLPDILLLLFMTTEQSLMGVIDVARKAELARGSLPVDRFSLIAIPILCRFDSSEEFQISRKWLDRSARELSEIYDSWLPHELKKEDFLEVTKIPYIPYFSFGEKLPVLEQGTIDSTGIGYAYESLAALIANNVELPEQLLENRSQYVQAARSQDIHKRKPSFPGALRAISNLSQHHPRNPNFTGRETLLSDLRSALTSGQPAALTQAITGLGGIGKTQLAVEYAYRHAADYTLIWWVRAEEPAALAADYAALAAPLNLPEKDDPEQPVVVEAVTHWFTQNPGWLLIFDNAPGPEQVRHYIPQGATGHVLVTSRNLAWRGLANPLTVPVWPRDESVAFLLKRIGQTDESAAAALAAILGDLPLALEQAGAYVEAKAITLAAYLDLFESRRTELWEKERPPLDYPATVATTWHIAFQQVRETSPVGADLLNLCAFLAPDDIPHDLLSQGTAHIPQPLSGALSDPPTFDEAVAALRRYDLLERTGDTFSFHRLVQAVARDRLPPDTRPTWAAAAVQIVNDAFPSGDVHPQDVRSWPECARLLPHALAAAGHAEALRVAPEATGHLLNQAGLYLKGRAQFAEAKAALERALAIAEAVYGPDHPNVASTANNLGSVLQDLGDLPAARDHLERALAIWEKQLGPEHPNVASAANNLGSLLQDLGDLPAARAAYERALAIDEATLGPDHPEIAKDFNNLSDVLQALGDLPGARAYLERALAIDEANLGPNHPNVARDVINLGRVLQDLGDLAGARAAFQRVLVIYEQVLGADHPNVATLVNNLGLVLKDLGDLAGARLCYERALAINEKVLGAEHPATAQSLNNLGGLLQAMGDLAGARPYYERALAINEKVLGAEHPATAQSLNNLGYLLQAMGDLAGARPYYERALAINEKVLRAKHPATARSLNNLGYLLQAMGDLAGARPYYERALAINEKGLGAEHPATAQSLNNLGGLLQAMGDLAGARPYYERALAILEKVLGADHPNTVTVRNNLRSLDT